VSFYALVAHTYPVAHETIDEMLLEKWGDGADSDH
jgi:hypothetical protein